MLAGLLHAQGRIQTADVRLPLLPASADSVRTAEQCRDALNPFAGTEPRA
jgi:dihydrodipicolinate synthase/N-acetylneuraminate lyase